MGSAAGSRSKVILTNKNAELLLSHSLISTSIWIASSLFTKWVHNSLPSPRALCTLESTSLDASLYCKLVLVHPPSTARWWLRDCALKESEKYMN